MPVNFCLRPPCVLLFILLLLFLLPAAVSSQRRKQWNLGSYLANHLARLWREHVMARTQDNVCTVADMT